MDIAALSMSMNQASFVNEFGAAMFSKNIESMD